MKNSDIKIIHAVGEVSLKYIQKESLLPDNIITNSEEAYNILKGIFDPETINHHEQMYALYLNRMNKVLGYALISKGGLASTTCDPKIVLQVALKLNASSIILAHNHPSGNLKPSKSDIEMTRNMMKAASLLEMNLLDHLILSDEGYTSLADECEE